MSFKQSDSFNQNRFFWKLFGIWPGKTANKYYTYFSITFLSINLILYNILLTINLYYTPRKIELMIREVLFWFTEIAISKKACMILFKRKKLLNLFDLLDCPEFQGNDDTGRKIVEQHNSNYKIYLSVFTFLANFSYMSSVFSPVICFLFFPKTLDLPICQDYFLSNETKNDYFVYIFIYQAFGMYGHMMYNVNIDTLMVGFMVMAIAQVKVLGHDLENLKKGNDSGRREEEHRHLLKLHRCVKHHELVIKYCHEFEDIISATMFVQYSVGSGSVCVAMCGFLLPSTMETTFFMVSYFFVMSLEIFVPAWLGSQLSYESQDLMVAAYKGDWIPRSEGYKRSLWILVERAKYPIIITGHKMFPLTLDTYISIMKTTYSCFTLVRFFLDRQEHA